MVCYDVIPLGSTISSEFHLNVREKMDQELVHVGRQHQKVFKKLLSIYLTMKLTSLHLVFQSKLKATTNVVHQRVTSFILSTEVCAE